MISKPATVRRGEYKCEKWELHLKLRDQQLKTTLYIYINCYIKTSWELQTKKLQQVHTQKRKSNTNTTLKILIKPKERRAKEEGKKKDLKKKIQKKKMAIGTYILIITLNVNGLNVPTKRQTG